MAHRAKAEKEVGSWTAGEFQVASAIERERDRYFEVLDALDDLVNSVLDEKAVELLRGWDRHPFDGAPYVHDDLGDWPFIAEPMAVSQAWLMFYAFRQGDGNWDIHDTFRNIIQAASKDAIVSWPEPMRTLIVETCALDEALIPPLEITKEELDQKATHALTDKILDLLKHHSSDLLIED